MSSITDHQSASKAIDLVVVLGMHRSGTSALTRGLAALGVDLGEHLIPGIDGDNVKGYFEDAEVHYVCDQVLASFGHSWSSLAPLGDADFADVAKGVLMDTAIRVMQARVGAGKVYGLKNPRMSAILPFWKMVFRQMNLTVGYVVAVRNPLSVASSMVRSALERDISFEKSHLLWLTHLSSSMAQTSDDPRVLVDFDLLLDSPAEQLQRLATGLGLPAPAADRLDDYTEAFLHEDLRHSVFSPDDLAQTEGVPVEVVQAYNLARVEAASTPPLKDAHAQEFFTRLWRELFVVKFVLSYLDRREAHFATASSIAIAAEAAFDGPPPEQAPAALGDASLAFSHVLTQGLRTQFEQVQRVQQAADTRHGARLMQLGREVQGVLNRLAMLGNLEDGIGRINTLMSSFEKGLHEIASDLRTDSAQQIAAVQALHEEAEKHASALRTGMDAQFEHLRHIDQLTQQQAKESLERSTLQAAALERQFISSAEQTSRAHEASLGGATAQLGALIASTSEGLRSHLLGRIDSLAGATDLDRAFEAIIASVGDLGTSLGGRFSQDIAGVVAELETSTTRHAQLVAQQREQAEASIARADAQLAELEFRHGLALKDLRTEQAMVLENERQRSAGLLHQAEVESNELRRISADMLAKRDEAMMRAQDQFGRGLAALSVQFDSTLAAMEKRIAEQQATFDGRLLDYKEQIVQRGSAHAAAVQALRQHQSEMLKEHDAALQDQAAHHARQTNLVMQSHASELRTVMDTVAAEFRRLSEDRDQRLQELQAQAEEARNRDRARIAELEQTLESMRGWRGMGLISWWNKSHPGGH